jgi:hypothetical protein
MNRRYLGGTGFGSEIAFQWQTLGTQILPGLAMRRRCSPSPLLVLMHAGESIGTTPAVQLQVFITTRSPAPETLDTCLGFHVERLGVALNLLLRIPPNRRTPWAPTSVTV